MKIVNQCSRRERNSMINKEIEKAVVEINQKYFSSALAKKDPNLQTSSALELVMLTPKSGDQRSLESGCPRYGKPQKEALKQIFERQETLAPQINIAPAIRFANQNKIVFSRQTITSGVKFIDEGSSVSSKAEQSNFINTNDDQESEQKQFKRVNTIVGLKGNLSRSNRKNTVAALSAI